MDGSLVFLTSEKQNQELFTLSGQVCDSRLQATLRPSDRLPDTVSVRRAEMGCSGSLALQCFSVGTII